MKYFYTSHNSINVQVFGQTHTVRNSLYRDCTLYLIKNRGICVIQQRYDANTKSFWWGALDPGLANDIYLNPGFYDFFKEHATTMDRDGGYFTITVRKLMWALRMKPLPKEEWEKGELK